MGGHSARLWSTARRTGMTAGVAALLLLSGANASLLRQAGCDSNSHFGLVRSIDVHGELSIDHYHWQTCDKSFNRGHFYSNKAPGLAFVGVPVFGVLYLAGIVGDHPPSVQDYTAGGDDLRGVTWPLALFGGVLPILILLLLVRRLGEEIAPGYGTAAAMTLGVSTLVLPFASTFFQHSLSAMLGFAAFALLWIERRGPPRLLLVAAGACAAAYSASVEYPLGLIGVLLFLYAMARHEQRLRRAAVYVAGGLLGILPLLVYNQVAFGSIRHLSYANQVRNQGQSGHDTLGAQAQGLYGVTSPRVHQGLSLVFGHKGLLTLGPVIALGLVGIVLLYRRGYRAEALVCAAVPCGFVGYNSGFYIGGDVPGPRYLIPMLPFLALPLALVWRRVPVTVLALSTVSAAMMLGATLTGSPWGGPTEVRQWFTGLAHNNLTHTLLTPLGAGHGWPAALPFVLLLAGSIVLAVRATPHESVRRRDAELAVGMTAGWLLLAGVGPSLLDRPGTAVDGAFLLLVAAVAALAWAVSMRGLWALAAAIPLVVVFSPRFIDRPGAVAVASGATLLIVGLVEALHAVRRGRPGPAAPGL